MEPDYPDPTFRVISSLDSYRENLTNHWRSTDQAPCLSSCSRFLFLYGGIFYICTIRIVQQKPAASLNAIDIAQFQEGLPLFLTHITNVYNFPYEYSIDQE